MSRLEINSRFLLPPSHLVPPLMYSIIYARRALDCCRKLPFKPVNGETVSTVANNANSSTSINGNTANAISI